MISNKFKWNQMSSNDIKRVQIKSKEFTWNQKNLNEIKLIYMKLMMNSQELKWSLMKFAKISEKCEFIGTFWEKCYYYFINGHKVP